MIDFMTKPRKKSDRHKARRITLRLPDRESRLLEELAEKNDRTLTAEVVRALRRYFKAEGADSPAPPPPEGD
jgi:hypothetical protein